MPLIPVQEFIDELPMASSATPFSLTGPREYERHFLVIMNERQVGPEHACFAPQIPLPLSSYANTYTGFVDFLARCVNISAKRKDDDDGRSFIVTCKYSTDTGRVGNPSNFGYPQGGGHPNDGKGMEDHPELESPELDFDTEEVLVPQLRDLDGRPFVNSALELVDPAPSIPYQRTILTLTRNELNYNCQTANLFAGATNDRTFAGFPKDSVLCIAPKARLMFKGPIAYYRVTYKLKFGYKRELVQQYSETGSPLLNPDGTIKYEDEYESFQYIMQDAGYQERIKESNLIFGGDPNVYRKIPIRDPNGGQLRSPVLLNGKGRRQIFVRPVTTDEGVADIPIPIYRKFRTRRRLNFTDLFTRGLGVVPPP